MTNSPNPPFFKADNISMNFGALAALKNVSFEVERGSVLGIAGPNGAGKTTLLNVIGGSLKPSTGEVTLDGENITGLKPVAACHQGVARTFQIPTVFPSLTVLENIEIGLVFGHAPGRKSSRKIEELINYVGLRGKENLLAANIDLFSRKLLMLAAALATDPKLLLLDEPLGGLNFREIEVFLKVIKEINREMGVALLVIEHLIDKLVEISINMIILNFGELIYFGPSEEVTENETVIEIYLGMKHHA
jgi:branched-chain amino acid transport system ATP-binding protein